MNSRFLEKMRSAWVLMALCLLPMSSRSVEDSGTPPDVAAVAWAQVEKLQGALHERPEWQGREPKPEELSAFQNKIRTAALELAKSARAFASRFPTNEFAGDARFFAILALCRAVAAGDAASEAEVKQFVAATLADMSIPEDDRIGVLLGAGNLPVMKKLGMKELIPAPGEYATEHEEATKASAREVIKQFPKSGKGYTLLLAIAERAKGEEQKRLAQELLEMDGASAAVKAMARHVLTGTKPFQIGQPLDIRFTALDGREVDLAALKGRVVLVDFWATDCGPCVAETPTIKSVYEKLHAKGFEIVGISLDDKESTLRRFIREKGLAWPQHFDGKGWENRFALHYGIFSIPTMWLVDRSGKLRFTSARDNLAGMVEALLAEKP